MEIQDKPERFAKSKLVHLIEGDTVQLYRDSKERLALCIDCVPRGSPGAPVTIAPMERTDGVTSSLRLRYTVRIGSTLV